MLTETTGFGYVGLKLCNACGRPNHVFAISDRADRELCVKCIEGYVHYENTVRIPYSETHPILDSEVTRCEICLDPEFATDVRWRLVESFLGDAETTVMAHAGCSARLCEECDYRYAHQMNRSWRGDNYPITRDRLTSIVTIEGRQHCGHCQIEFWLQHDGSEYFECNACESHTHYDNAGWYNGDRFCRTCIDQNVFNCGDCDVERWDGDDHECEYDDENSLIHDYSYKPSPFFFGAGSYHFGFELEVEARNSSRYEGASVVQDALGGRVYLKEDGSLNDGFEIVTHPHTLENYHKEFNWTFLDRLKDDGFRSWNTTSCGLHVHVSRTAFGKGDPWEIGVPHAKRSRLILSRQSHELRFMKLIYDNQRQVERISGRSSTRYASFEDKGNLVRKVKYGSQENGRFSAVNTENSETIEIRVFKGSLRKERVLSAIEFVHASVEYTRDIKVTSENRALSWIKFTGYVASNSELYPNLVTIMSESFANDSAIDDGND